jgi:hypothetical protein
VYQLGVTLFECLTLRRPFEPDNRAALYRSILHDDAPDVRHFNPTSAPISPRSSRARSRRIRRAATRPRSSSRSISSARRTDCPISAGPIGPAPACGAARARSPGARSALARDRRSVAIGAPISTSRIAHDGTTRGHAEQLADRATERADSTYASARLDPRRARRPRVAPSDVEGNAAAEPMQRELLAPLSSCLPPFLAYERERSARALDVARAHQRIALIHREFGELAAAEGAFDRAIEVLEELAADPSAPYERLHELSVALHDRSRVFRADRGRTALAERDLTSALETLESPRRARETATFEHDVPARDGASRFGRDR